MIYVGPCFFKLDLLENTLDYLANYFRLHHLQESSRSSLLNNSWFELPFLRRVCL
jgi:hypothetical protein